MDGNRICVLTSIHPDYDARVFRHARALATLGFNVDLIAPWQPDYPLPEGLALKPFRRVVKRRLRLLLIPWRIAPLLFRGRYDLVHFHDIDLLPLLALYRLITRRAVVYDCHENYGEEMLYRYHLGRLQARALSVFVSAVERGCARIVRNVVAVVPEQLKRFPAPSFDTVVVRNFAERDLERGRVANYRTRAPACISIASQYVDNGALLLLEIAAEVARRKPSVVFYVADRFHGDLAFRETFLMRLQRSGLDQTVRMVNNVRPPDIMQNLNLGTIGLALDLDVPHRRLALPIRLFEYMAAGIPIVAADLPNIHAIVTDAACGVLIRPGDIRGFADAICDLVDDPDRAELLGANGSAAFRLRYNWESEVTKLLPLYRRV